MKKLILILLFPVILIYSQVYEYGPGVVTLNSQHMIIGENETLKFVAGTTVLFSADNLLQIRGGRLLVEGTEEEPVYFKNRFAFKGIKFKDCDVTSTLNFLYLEDVKKSGEFGDSFGAIGIFNSNVFIRNSYIVNTVVEGSSMPISHGGGGVFITGGKDVSIINTIIANCSAHTGMSMGDFSGSGGGILVKNISGEINLKNNSLLFNKGIYGGGIALFDIQGLVNIKNNVIVNNTSLENGGGIYCDSISNENIVIINNSIVNNEADVSGGGVFVSDNSNEEIIIKNSILWSNFSSLGANQFAGQVTTSYCHIEGVNDENPMFFRPTVEPGSGMFNSGNHIYNVVNNLDWHIDPRSVCIDSGDPLTQSLEPDGSVVNQGAYGNTFEAQFPYSGAPLNPTGNYRVLTNTAMIFGGTGMVNLSNLTLECGSRLFLMDCDVSLDEFIIEAQLDSNFTVLKSIGTSKGVSAITTTNVDVDKVDLRDVNIIANNPSNFRFVNSRVFSGDNFDETIAGIEINNPIGDIEIFGNKLLNFGKSIIVNGTSTYRGEVNIANNRLSLPHFEYRNGFDGIRLTNVSNFVINHNLIAMYRDGIFVDGGGVKNGSRGLQQVTNNIITFDDEVNRGETSNTGITIKNGDIVEIINNTIIDADTAVVIDLANSGRLTNNRKSFNASREDDEKVAFFIKDIGYIDASYNQIDYDIAFIIMNSTKRATSGRLTNNRKSFNASRLTRGAAIRLQNTGIDSIYNNTIFASTIALECNGTTQPIAILNNIFWSDEDGGSSITSSENNLEVRYNDINGSITGASTVENNINVYPNFISTNFENEQFLKLMENSACVDAGIDVGVLYNGYAPDMGGFESEYALNSVPFNLIPTIDERAVELNWEYFIADSIQESFEPIFLFNPFSVLNIFPPEGWTTIDNDQDGNYWLKTDQEANYGTNSARSYSYENGVNLSPDNWLITKQIEIRESGFLSYFVKPGTDNLYRDESYSVLLSTTGKNPDDFTEVLFEETLNSSIDVFVQRTIDLSEFEGQVVYVAFRHYNTIGQHFLAYDDIIINGNSKKDLVFSTNNKMDKIEKVYNTRISHTIVNKRVINSVKMEKMITKNNVKYTPFEFESKSIIGYNIYRDNVIVKQINSPLMKTYIDTVPDFGSYSYFVTALLNIAPGETDPSETVDVFVNTEFSMFKESFENEFPPIGWILYDNDGDTNNWFQFDPYYAVQDGEYCIISESYGGLTPDNWIVSPMISLPSGNEFPWELSFWVSNGSSYFYEEHYELKLSTTGNDIADFTILLHEENLTEDDYNDWRKVVVNLNDYAGSDIYIAWVHNETANMMSLNLDDIRVYEHIEVGINENNLPQAAKLYQNYPNPFNPITKISYQFAVNSEQLAEIVIYNAAGQQVWSQNLSTDHSSPFTGYCTFDGSKFNSGVYYYSLIIDGKQISTKKMIMIK